MLRDLCLMDLLGIVVICVWFWIAGRLLGWFDCWWFILVVLGLWTVLVVCLLAVRVWLLVVVCFVSGCVTVLLGCLGLLFIGSFAMIVADGCFGVGLIAVLL